MKTVKRSIIFVFTLVLSSFFLHAEVLLPSESVSKLLQQYYSLKDALIKSDATLSAKEAEKMLHLTEKISASKVPDKELVEKLKVSLKKISEASDLDIQRKEFKPLSENMHAFIAFSGYKHKKVYVQHCPMALGNQGGVWLSNEKEIRNPYFGDKMLKCGVVQEEL
ncbi:DUF3347 domain-containing protein [Cytophagaceae bacterium ABcell3]|nr:DUF3347 domain-containing protein [Cytophagaceae bacterium ABcell3]